jgi:mannosyl-oligosaccharide alpha-1,3-glucosidase
METGLTGAQIYVTKNETAGTIRIGYGKDRAVLINVEPFDMVVLLNDNPVVGINKNKLMHLEPYRQKAQQEVGGAGELGDAADAGAAAEGEDRHKGKKVVGYWEDGLAIYEDGTREEKLSAEEEAAKQRRLQEAAADDDWKEYFGGHTDTRPYGPASVGLDVVFYGSENLYGAWHGRSMA